jgi:hypothetical protein
MRFSWVCVAALSFGREMAGGKYEAQTFKMPPHHGWRCKPGYKIFVANRGDVRFDIPRKWVMTMPGQECDVEFRDRKSPNDDCVVQLSVFSHPPGIDWTEVPLHSLSRGRSPDDPDHLWRGEEHYEKRPGAELVWSESAFLDPQERREARSRQVVGRGPQSHAIVTMSYWPEHEKRFLPVWDELLRSLTLGVYLRDPLLGE